MSLNDLSTLSQVNEELKREIAERRRAETELEQRNQLLSTLLDVSNLVSSTLELKPLLEAILDRLKIIIDYKGAKIFIIEGEVLRVFAHRSPLSGEEEMNYFLAYKKLSLSREIVMEKRLVIIEDIQIDTPDTRDFREAVGSFLETTLKYIRSWMGIPLIVKDKVIGVLTLDHSEPGYYLSRHAEIGRAFAHQVAIEYENAWLYNETHKRADELMTLFSVQQAITSRLELDTAIQRIADEAKRLTSSERTAVFMTDGDDLVLSVFSGKVDSGFLGYRISINDSLLGQSLLFGKPLIVNDAQNHPIAYPGLVEKAGIHSFLCVPLIADTKRIGIIAVADKKFGEFDQDDRHILSMLASIAVIGIENARMYQEELRRHREDEQRRRVAEGLRDILAILNSNRPLPEILEYIIQQAVRLLGTDTGALFRLKAEEGILNIEASHGFPEAVAEQVTIPVGMGIVGRSVRERKPIVTSDISDMIDTIPAAYIDDPKRNPYLTWIREYYHGLLAVPLLCKDEVYGAIVLYYREKRNFVNEEVELAMTFADQAALAIDNARLREQAEEIAIAAERSRLARDLHDAVTQTLFSASLIAEVLPRIWERNPEEGRRRLDELRQLARGALAEMRTLLLELRPATLVEAGLEELLKHLTEAVTGRSRIPVTLNMEGDAGVPVDVKIAFYRIAQEALNNIAKHSDASKAAVTLRCKKGTQEGTNTAELVVSDDGRGFNPREVTGEHLGVNIMQERAQSIGARLTVRSRLKQGTDIIIQWESNG